jgi:hypothetical protein
MKGIKIKMTEYDLMYMSWIGDRIIKDPEMTDYWVSALKEHISFLQKIVDEKKAQNWSSEPNTMKL